MATQPVIIKKVKKGKGHGSHGGAWKLAYADFVTAMMAFFLLMWLLGFSKEETRKGIADYFDNPYKVSLLGGDSVGDRTSVIKGGGSDLSTKDPGETKSLTSDQAAAEKAEAIDMHHLDGVKEKIQTLIEEKPELHEHKDQIKLEINHEGLKILVIDSQNRPMFKIASAQAEPHTRLILKELAPIINELPNKISINGHTDALPFPGNQTGYTNWELSSDRANAARRELVKAGIREERFMRIIGLASSSPYNVKDRLDPMNRRISIVLMSHRSEEQVIQETSAEASENASAAQPSQPIDMIEALEALEAAQTPVASPPEIPH